MATTVGIGQHTAGEGFRWNYATGWSRRSGHDAGMEAEKACRSSSGETCWTTGLSSMRGGCVAMVEGLWLDKDAPQEEAGSFRGHQANPKDGGILGTGSVRESDSLWEACGNRTGLRVQSEGFILFGGCKTLKIGERPCGE